ncbi:hypothetical protein [Miltoncostaea oceani]|uniref:hypothetical protein n=1 Tax=Miltoncostaea oceani TaxID=2843216 RepID=UPI001C3D9959|nr:hypothetical protein [Miltoncostaea oceani]
MDALPPPPPGLATTRTALQRVATHIVARRRHDLTGRFGLRAAPGGLASPAVGGHDVEVVRTDGDVLLVERGGAVTATRMTTLADLAAAAGVDLAAPFAAGHDAPPVGDPAAPLGVGADAARALGRWWCFATTVLDEVTAWIGPGATPTPVQLWPEHFDVACDVAWGPAEGMRANLGGSPGDGSIDEPYLYLGPWDAARPGDPAYWNASFGAVLTLTALRGEEDPHAAAVAFLQRGLGLLAAG